MPISGQQYAPPDVYTQTRFENPLGAALDSLKIPVLVGEGNEALLQEDLEIARGSSAIADTRVVDEDASGRAVLSVSGTGVVTLTDFDGTIDKLQTRHFPIVDGSGNAITTNNRTDVQVTVNGTHVVVRTVTGAKGIIQLAQAPNPGDVVRVTYFFDRSDTQMTDELSAQVPNTLAVVRAESGLASGATLNLHGDILVNGVVSVPANNGLVLRVDGKVRTLTITPRTTYVMTEIAAALTAMQAGTLLASTFVNNVGEEALVLTATSSLEVLEGSANGLLGLVTGSADNRTSTFYVFQRPIVDGTGGGVTTTDPSHVTVKVDGKQVIPTSVDGASGAVTLPVSPKAGAKVVVTYYWNSWQDTFDYLAHIGVTQVVRAGAVPKGSDYIQGADFVLANDKIVWGTAATVEAGVATADSTLFGESQVSLSLVDSRNFLGECSAVVRASGGVAKESRTEFTLPLQPTLGNGRDTPLGQSLYQTVSNGRIDLPVNRPDVVWAYWGWNAQDAFLRGRVEVLKVDGLNITLSEPVPPGATVFATSYYNTIQDQSYTVTAKNAGVSGVGTYEVTDAQGADVFGTKLLGKGAGLTGVTLEFPSGSELNPDFRFESVDSTDFTGPVEEIVTVTLASRTAGPARYTFPGAAPYYTVSGFSDHLRLQLRGNEAPSGGAGIDLTAPAVGSNWALPHLIGEEINYTGGAGATVGQSFTTDAEEEFVVNVDGTEFTVVIPPMTNSDATFIAQFINESACGHQGTCQAGSIATTVVLNASKASPMDDYYVGYKIVSGYSATGGMIAGGQVRTITAYTASTQTATLSAQWAGGTPPPVNQPYFLYNPNALSYIEGNTQFDGAVTIDGTHFNALRIHYTGATTLTTGAITATLTSGTYDTPSALAEEITTQLAASIATFTGTGGNEKWLGLAVFCEATVDGALRFSLQLAGQDASGYLKFLNAASDAVDMAILAGLPRASAVTDNQAALVQGPIARAYEVPASGDRKLYDRIVLRGRLLPPTEDGPLSSVYWADMAKVQVVTSYELGGLVAGTTGTCKPAYFMPAHAEVRVSLQNGQDTGGAFWPGVTFYDGSGTRPANNVLNLSFSGVPVTVTFTASGSGTFTKFGPVATSGTVTKQLSDAISAALTAAGVPSQYTFTLLGGTSCSFMSHGNDVVNSRLVVSAGSANSVLGLTTGSFFGTPVQAEDIASALMSSANSSLATWLTSSTSFSANTFANYAIAGVVQDTTGAKYLYVQDAPTSTGSLGTASTVTVKDAPSQNALAYGTKLNAEDGDGDVGDPSIEGFFVTSSNPDGSGSADTSILNTGTGADGLIGQTYRDAVTGLTFTLLPRGFTTNPSGPWAAYPVGGTSTFRINVSKSFSCDANIPTLAIPGVEMRVSNTLGVEVDDTAIVRTFARSGNEPAIGDLYYVTYVYAKQDYATTFFTKMSAVEKTFGAAIPENPVSLATQLAMINGALLVGVKQVQKEAGSTQAALTTYRTAIEELEGVLPGGITPDIVTPLRGDSLDLFQILRLSNDKMSSPRYKSERTSIVGVSAGTLPQTVMSWAPALANTRMRIVYPDMATISIQDNLGGSKEYLVDGPFVAAAMAGSVVSPNVDVATPWTGRRLVGFTQLARKLDAVTMNQIAVKGVTILEDRASFLRVRHGLTTDMSTILTKLPTVVQISDEVQRQSRSTLEVFVGVKFLPNILSQLEGRLSMTLKQLVFAQIITAYTGVSAVVSPNDPTTSEVEASYSPVFPLLYILVNFNLRSSLV